VPVVLVRNGRTTPTILKVIEYRVGPRIDEHSEDVLILLQGLTC